MLKIAEVGSCSALPLAPVIRLPLLSARVNSGTPLMTEIVFTVPVTVDATPEASTVCAETVLPMRPADCITEKFDWNDENDVCSELRACTDENCASCAIDAVVSIG